MIFERHKNNEQINIHTLPGGMFLSTDLQKERLKQLRNNTQYREAIEKAQKMTGSTDRLLFYSRGGRDKILDAMTRNVGKAERFLKTRGKGIENENHSRIILAR
jgi:hypothetical protein